MSQYKVLKENKHANFKFNLLEKIEAGIVLKGKDVKDFKNNDFEIRDSLIRIERNEAYIYNLFLKSSADDLTKKRKLLLNKKEIINLSKTLQNRTMHAYASSAYINEKGIVKILVGIGTIKKKSEHRSADKRTSEKRELEKYIKSNS
jgi:SsrA-binding protein